MSNPFENARWIAAAPHLPSLPIFRRSFTIDRPLDRALIRLCGLGQHELRVNHQKAGDDVLEPAWSNYAKTCYYVTHDVTPLLRTGENVIDVWLGNGMYNVGGDSGAGAAGGKRYKKFKGSFGPAKLICQLHLDFTDGTSQQLVTDAAWRVAPGPITFSCIYGGEDHDARRELVMTSSLFPSPGTPGDASALFPSPGTPGEGRVRVLPREHREPSPQPSPGVPGEGENSWRPVQIVDGPGGSLLEQTSPPLRVVQTFRAVKITEPTSGKRVYDLGQNFSGRPLIAARGVANQSITLTPGELLDETGCVTQKNTGSPVTFTYTLRGDPNGETWHPRFTYTGFRYLQAEGDLSALLDVQGQFIHSAAKQIGRFECSSDLFNRIHTLILNAIKSNLQHVITDCPHREKLGWLEQTHLMGDAILFNFDAAALYEKISRDMRDAQHDSGCVPTIAPQYTSFKPPWDVFNDSPEWGSACVINPWLLYRRTGERAILEENYDSMKRYVDYLRTRQTPEGILDYGLGDWYDIGPGDPGFSKLTSKAVTATGIYRYDVVVMQKVAQLLGRGEDAQRYLEMSRDIRAAFNRKLYDKSTKRYDTGSQTAQAIALFGQLADDPQAILDHLIADIRAHDNHITAGDIGFYFVIRALADRGRSDVVFDLLTRTDPPSYGAQLARGATTLTEAWDANPKVSQNHLMLGHAEVWFYQYLAGIGIDLSQPAPRQITIAPTPVGDITWAEASYQSALGPIAVRWERTGERFDLSVSVPVPAQIHLPNEPEKPLEVPPGRHRFTSVLTA